jgi:CheY-like chemotaxis protein
VQRIESVGRLAGGIAHDFNNLLTVILGQAELLTLDLPPESELLEGVTQIRHAAESGSALTRQLLGFARRQMVAPQVIDINQLARRVPTLMGRLLGERVTLSLELTEDPPFVRVDPSQFDQVMVNLAMNARDAMPAGGRIVLRTRRIPETAQRRAEFVGVVDGDLAQLEVIDSGTGMSADVRDRAFEPFFTTKGIGKGTGLGLATTYGIVTQAGGAIALDSTIGEGTAVRIVLPVSREAPTVAPLASTHATLGGTETVLVVDDDASVRSVTASALRRQGYRVLEAESGPSAIGASRAERGRIQLLVTDVVMPHMSGPALADHLRAERTDMRVLFVSGYAEGAVTEHGVLSEGLHILQKPFDIFELARRVRLLLDEPTYAT